MSKLLSTNIPLPITNVANTIRALLQNSTNKKWLFVGSDAALHASTGNLSALELSDLSMRSLSASEDFTGAGTDYAELTVTVEGTEKIRVLSPSSLNLATEYKTPETVYFKHLGEIVDGFAKGKFSEFVGCTGVMVDQTAGKIYAASSATDTALDAAPVVEAEIEVDAPTNDFGE